MAKNPRKETPAQRRAFETYYGFGVGRTYNAVAKEVGVSIATVKLWGRRFAWQSLVRERDLEVARAAADGTFKGEVESRVRQIQIVGLGLLQVAKAIAEAKRQSQWEAAEIITEAKQRASQIMKQAGKK